jgi:hypothetical protein
LLLHVRSIKSVEEIEGFEGSIWKPAGKDEVDKEKINEKSVRNHLNYLANLILEVITNEDHLSYDTFVASDLFEYMQKYFNGLDAGTLYTYFLPIYKMFAKESNRRFTEMTVQIFRFGPIVDRLAGIYMDRDICEVQWYGYLYVSNNKQCCGEDAIQIHRPKQETSTH